MKIYFAGSIRGGRVDQSVYNEIIALLQQHGTVLTEHIGAIDLSTDGEVGLTNQEIFNRDLGWIKEADAVVAEVTNPSMGVGYELGIAESLGKRILCLVREVPGRRLSAMIAGNKGFAIEQYQKPEEVSAIFDKFFKKK